MKDEDFPHSVLIYVCQVSYTEMTDGSEKCSPIKGPSFVVLL